MSEATMRRGQARATRCHRMPISLFFSHPLESDLPMLSIRCIYLGGSEILSKSTVGCQAVHVKMIGNPPKPAPVPEG
eukprot:16275-Rhodomonas_salina.3